MVPKLLSCLSLMTSTGAISRSLIRKEAIHKDVESAPTCASYTTACPFDRIHASHNKLCGSTCDEVTCCESPRRQLLQERMQSPTASPTEVAILCSADSCRATASAKGYNQFGINDEWPFNGGSNTEYSPGCYVYASAVGQQIVFYGDHGSTAEKMAPLSGDVQRIGGACMQASDCGCLEYTLSGFTGNSWYNGVWGRSGMCGNGKPVYTKGGNRYLNFDSDEDRWEFSDTECQTTLNWYPGVVGQQCPISFESGGTWTCSTAPPTVTTVTTIDCQGDRCTGSNVNVNSDYTVVECVGEDACRDATIERQNNAQHVLILCNGKAACKGNNGIDNWVAGDDWTVSCYGGQDVCVDWGIEETGATKCSGNSCPITLQATTPSPTGAPGASNCSCLEYTLAGFSAGSSWYNGVWGKSGMCDNGKPVYSKGNRYLNFDSGENRWEFSDTECETTSNWYPGVVGQQCPISVESGGSWTCIIQAQSSIIYATDGRLTAPFMLQQGGYAEIEPAGEIQDALLEFDVLCTGSAPVTFKAEIIAPDKHADSFRLQVDDGSNPKWHTGQGSSWFWSLTSPSMSMTSHSHTVKLHGRDAGIKIRALRFESGMSEANCQWQQAETPLRDFGGAACTSSSKCSKCQGDCDNDADCVIGLRCFKRSSSDELVPGCLPGGSGDIGTHSYCYEPHGPPATVVDTRGNTGHAYCSSYCANNWNSELPVAWTGACCLRAVKTSSGEAASCTERSPSTGLTCTCQRDDDRPFITGMKFNDERYVCSEEAPTFMRGTVGTLGCPAGGIAATIDQCKAYAAGLEDQGSCSESNGYTNGCENPSTDQHKDWCAPRPLGCWQSWNKCIVFKGGGSDAPSSVATPVCVKGRTSQIECGTTNSHDCQMEYHNAIANGNLEGFCNRCRTELGTGSLRSGCKRCCTECNEAPPANFIVGSTNTETCTGNSRIVTDAISCQAAAGGMRKTYEGEDDAAGFPHGCYTYLDTFVYLNTNEAEAGKQVDSAPICMATPPTPASSPTPPPAPPLGKPTVGWFLGGAYDSCTSTCSRRGLQCTTSGFAQHNAEVNTDAEMSSVINKLGATCTSFEDDHGENGRAPYLRPKNNKCIVSSAGRPEDTFKCEREAIENMKRLCWCEASPRTYQGWCENGINFGRKCCAASCGTCGGDGCGDRPGGSSQCCGRFITSPCTSSTQVGCEVPSTHAMYQTTADACASGWSVVGTTAECQRAATALSRTFVSLDASTNGPFGCYENLYGDVYFNTNVGGPLHPNRKLVCKQTNGGCDRCRPHEIENPSCTVACGQGYIGWKHEAECNANAASCWPTDYPTDKRYVSHDGLHCFCRQTPTPATPSPAPYIRLPTGDTSCPNSGYRDVETVVDCEKAFHELSHASKWLTDVGQDVQEKSYSFQPKGCFSLNFNDDAGYYSRYFNTHPSGSTIFHSGVGGEGERFKLCRTDASEPEVPLAKSAGWYASRTDGDCSETCAAIGLHCSTEDFHAHNGDVDTASKALALVKQALRQGNPAEHDDNGVLGCSGENGFAAASPWFDHWCTHSQPGRSLESFSCTSKPDGGKKRLCYCSEEKQPECPFPYYTCETCCDLDSQCLCSQTSPCSYEGRDLRLLTDGAFHCNFPKEKLHGSSCPPGYTQCEQCCDWSARCGCDQTCDLQAPQICSLPLMVSTAYTRAADTSEVCPSGFTRVHDPFECKAAARFVGLQFSTKRQPENFNHPPPRGCYGWGQTNVFFNNQEQSPSYTPSGKVFVVCKRHFGPSAPTPAPPTTSPPSESPAMQGVSWTAHVDAAIGEGSDLTDSGGAKLDSKTQGWTASVELCKKKCEKRSKCMGFSMDKAKTWCRLKAAKILTTNTRIDTYVIEPTPGWYLTEALESCTSACWTRRMKCTSSGLAQHNGEVDTDAKIASVLNGLGAKCASYNSDYTETSDVPNIDSHGQCYVSAVGRAEHSFSCTTPPPNLGKKRLCWCEIDCSAAGARAWPNGCCSGLVTCDEPRSKDDQKYCDRGNVNHDKTCWSSIKICRKQCIQPTPPPTADVPEASVQVLDGGKGFNFPSVTCVRDESTTKLKNTEGQDVNIAAQCCEVDGTCRRFVGSDDDAGCISGKPPVETTYAEAMQKCAEKGLQLCEKSCSGEGCNYDAHPVWTKKPCEVCTVDSDCNDGLICIERYCQGAPVGSPTPTPDGAANRSSDTHGKLSKIDGNQSSAMPGSDAIRHVRRIVEEEEDSGMNLTVIGVLITVVVFVVMTGGTSFLPGASARNEEAEAETLQSVEKQAGMEEGQEEAAPEEEEDAEFEMDVGDEKEEDND